MKTILVLLILVSIAFGTMMHMKRSATAESVVLEIDYHGSCSDFRRDLTTVRVSSFPNDTCLPITNVVGNDDKDDLDADYTCTNVGSDKSVVRLVEIYLTHGTPVVDFIVSFVPSNPFRATDGGVEVQYIRRPSCNKEENYCAPTATFAVTQCTDNLIEKYRGKVNSKDRIYLLPKTKTAHTCLDSTGNCCAYISLAPGICPFIAPTEVIIGEDGKGFNHKGEEGDDGPHHFPWDHFHVKNVDAKREEEMPEIPAPIVKKAPPKNPLAPISIFPKEELDKTKLVMEEEEEVREIEEIAEKRAAKVKKPVLPVEDENDPENDPEPLAKELFTLGHK